MKRLIVLGALAGLLLPGAASAQDYHTQLMASRNGAGREALVDPAATHRFGTCVADTQGGTSILEMLPATTQEIDFVFSSSRWPNDCQRFNRGGWVGARFMRGAAAEYLLEHRVRFPQSVFAMPTLAALEGMSADTRAQLAFIVVGECAARANPAGVTALLATNVGTPEERAAFASVLPSLANCVPQGVNFQMPPLQVRGYLAEGAYRNAAAARTGQN